MLKEILLHRLPTAAAVIAALAGLFWLDAAVFNYDLFFGLFIIFVGALVTLEIYRMADGSRRATEIRIGKENPSAPPGCDGEAEFRLGDPLKTIGVFSTLILIALDWIADPRPGFPFALNNFDARITVLSVLFLGIIFAASLRASKAKSTRRVVTNIALTLFGIAVGWLLCRFTLQLRHFGTTPSGSDWLQTGQWLVVGAMATAKCMDIGGMIIGKALGKRRITPLVSPKKTWEGLAGGLTLSLLVGGALSQTVVFSCFTLGQTLAFSAIMALSGFFGDLFGSLLKRSTGVKDSGGTIRGWGGMIDLVDSMLVAGPVAVIVAPLFGLVLSGS
ncbi:MAG: phosphatidate cytidylyltransferase [Planctomycetota bacterium]